MKGRNPKPASKLAEDNRVTKKTKKNIKMLQDHTVILGGKHFHAPKAVRDSKVAKAKWLEIMELYKESDLDITTNADVGLLERYALTYAEYKQLMEAKMAAIERYPANPIAQAQLMHELRIDTKINQKNTLLMRMDEQLFLTPLSKCRSVPRTKKDPKKERLKERGFNL